METAIQKLENDHETIESVNQTIPVVISMKATLTQTNTALVPFFSKKRDEII